LVAWASSPARPTPIHPRRERQGLPALFGDYWKNEIAPKVPEMLDRDAIEVKRIVATPKSAIQ
jgi:hypothetical protein